MRAYETVEQIHLFNVDTPSTKMSPEFSPPTRETISRRSCKNSSALSSKKYPIFLCLKRGGANSDQSAVWEMTEHPFPWLGGSTMHSTTVYHRDGKESAYWLTSGDTQHRGYCLTLNTGERPRQENRTRLSEILESNPDPRYNLSAVACQGVLNRAQNRGKELPAQLSEALAAQIERENR